MHISRERITIAVNPSHLPILLFGQNETRFAMNSSEMGSAYIPVYCCTEPKNYAPPPPLPPYGSLLYSVQYTQLIRAAPSIKRPRSIGVIRSQQ